MDEVCIIFCCLDLVMLYFDIKSMVNYFFLVFYLIYLDILKFIWVLMDFFLFKLGFF